MTLELTSISCCANFWTTQLVSTTAPTKRSRWQSPGACSFGRRRKTAGGHGCKLEAQDNSFGVGLVPKVPLWWPQRQVATQLAELQSSRSAANGVRNVISWRRRRCPRRANRSDGLFDSLLHTTNEKELSSVFVLVSMGRPADSSSTAESSGHGSFSRDLLPFPSGHKCAVSWHTP